MRNKICSFKNGICDRIKKMKEIYFQKDLVKTLNDYWRKDGAAPTREEFVSYFIQNKRFYNLFRFWKKNEEKLREVDDTLGDCLEGKWDYIGYADKERMKLRLTQEGRDFITWPGFLNQFIKRYGELKSVLIATPILLFLGYFIRLIGGWLYQLYILMVSR